MYMRFAREARRRNGEVGRRREVPGGKNRQREGERRNVEDEKKREREREVEADLNLSGGPLRA